MLLTLFFRFPFTQDTGQGFQGVYGSRGCEHFGYKGNFSLRHFL